MPSYLTYLGPLRLRNSAIPHPSNNNDDSKKTEKKSKKSILEKQKSNQRKIARLIYSLNPPQSLTRIFNREKKREKAEIVVTVEPSLT